VALGLAKGNILSNWTEHTPPPTTPQKEPLTKTQLLFAVGSFADTSGFSSIHPLLKKIPVMDTGSLGPSTVTGRRQSPGACWPPGAGCVSGQEQLVLPCPAAPQQKFALADVLCGTWWPLWPNL